MSAGLDAFAAYFEGVNCEFERVGDDVITAGIEVEAADEEGEPQGEGNGVALDVIIQSDHDEDGEEEQLAVYVNWPLQVPEDKLAQAAEFVLRANFGVLVGSIELDFDDGEVRSKTGLDVFKLDDAACETLFQNSMNLTMMYFPALQAVLDGMGVEEALAEVEG